MNLRRMVGATMRDCSRVGITEHARERRKWCSREPYYRPWKRFYLARYLNCFVVAHISRMTLSPYFLMIQHYLRWYSDWNHASRCILPGDQFRVYVAIQFVVDIIVADVFQGSAASGAFETLHVKILVLDSHEHTSAERERGKEKE